MKRLLALTFVFVLLGVVQQPLSAQSNQPAFYETVRIGRGAVQHIEWQPHGENILADTIRGAWIYQSDGSQLVDVRHLEDARLARFSPDGRFLAGVNAQNEITLWDATIFTWVKSLPGHTAYVRALEWSPDGNRLASLDRDGMVFVWDVGSAKKVLELHLTGADKLAWSRGGHHLAAFASQSGAVDVWDGAGKLIFAQPHFGANILWRTDTQLLSLTNDEIPKGPLWDVTTGQKITTVRHGYATGYNSDGSKLAGSNIGRAWIADGATGTILSLIDGPQGSVVKWSPNDQYIAFGDWTPKLSEPGHLRVVEASTAKIVAVASFDHTITGIDWNSNSTSLVIVDSASRIFEELLAAPTDFPIRTNAHTDVGTLAAWRSDGQAIAAANTRDGASLWDANSGDSLIEQMGIGQPVYHLAWQPKGALLALSGGDGWQSLNNNFTIWDTQLPSSPDFEPIFVVPHLDLVAGIAWSPDGETLVSAERSRYLRVWSPQSPNDIHVIDLWKIRTAPYIDYSQRIETLEWPANGKLAAYSFASSGNGGGVQLIDVDVDPAAFAPAETPNNYASTWAWTADHRFVWARWGSYGDPGPSPNDVAISVKGQGLTDPSGAPMILRGLSSPVTNAIFSPDASALIGFDDQNHGIVWDIATQKVRAQLTGVNDAVWSPDSAKVAVFATDDEIDIRDVQSGDVVYRFDRHFRGGPSYLPSRTQVIWSPDSQKIAVLDSGALFIYTLRSFARYPSR